MDPQMQLKGNAVNLPSTLSLSRDRITQGCLDFLDEARF